MAKLMFKYSTMNAGKTMDLLRINHNYNENGKETLCLTSAKDDRYGVGKITSRIGISIDAMPINDDSNIFEIVTGLDYDPSCILIDEVQFFTKEQIFQLSDIVDRLDIPVIAYGIRSDFSLSPFSGSLYMMTIADEIEELKTLCVKCDKKAVLNIRYRKPDNLRGQMTIVTEGEQIGIGGNDSYVPMCRKCYKELLELNGKMAQMDTSVIPEGQYCYTGLNYSKGVYHIKPCPYNDYKIFKDEIGEILVPYCSYLDEGSIPMDDHWKNQEFERLQKILNLTEDELNEKFGDDVLWDGCKICGINNGNEEDYI